MLTVKSQGTGRLEGCSGRRTLTGAGGPGPSASPPLLSLDEPGLKTGPGDVTGPTPQSPVALGLCTGCGRERTSLGVDSLTARPFLLSQASSPQLSPVTAADGFAPIAPGYQGPAKEQGWGLEE